MSGYTLTHWAFCFFFYCVVGWVWECFFIAIDEKRIENRGFLFGPMIPIYGCGAVVLLFVTLPFRENYVLTFLAGMIGATLLEYVTGVVMEAIFKVRYWDYSEKKFNYKGHIWLFASIGWGVAAIVLTKYLQVYVQTIMYSIPEKTLHYIVIGVGALFLIDLTLSVKTALDIKDVLVKIEAVKGELSRMQKRMDVILAFVGEGKSQYIEAGQARIDDMLESLESKIAFIKGKIGISDETKEEIAVFKGKLSTVKNSLSSIVNVKDVLRKAMIKGNPKMVSAKFGDSLEELKKYFNSDK